MQAQKYIGVKLIEGQPQEKDGQAGYQVDYLNGHMSWSPQKVFEGAYTLTDRMSFGLAFEALRMGYHIRREIWDSASFVQIQKHPESPQEIVMIQLIWQDRMRAYPWQPSQIELLARDWRLLIPHQLNQQGTSLK